MKSSDALASFDHESSCWRTSQASLLQTLDASSDVFSGPWPRSGTMRNGVCYPQPTLARPTSESGSGSWPTPNSSDYKGAMTVEACKAWEFRGTNLPEAAVTWATPTVDDANNVTRTSGSQQSLARDTFMWATPSSRDWKDTPGMSDTGTNPDGTERDRADQLPRQVFPWAGLTRPPSEAPTTPSDSSPAKPRRAGLNPRFGLWLMGYSAAWLDSVESATASSPRARSKSSAPLKGESL